MSKQNTQMLIAGTPPDMPPDIQALVATTQKLSTREPTLALNHAVALDKQLTSAGWLSPVTIAAHGVAGPGWNTDAAPPSPSNTLFTISQRAPASRGGDAHTLAYQHVRGAEIPALNLMYANMCLGVESLWLHFINKYLAYFSPANTTPSNTSLSNTSTAAYYRLALKPGGAARFNRLHAPAHTKHVVSDGPLVSVLMPVYNAADTLRLAAESILEQTWKNIELILIDDVSTDNSLNIAYALAEADPRVKVLPLKVNGGPYRAKNAALSVAEGAYITVHDADDWAMPTRIADQLNPLLHDKTGKLAVTAGRMLRMDESGCITRFEPTNHINTDGALRLCFPSPMIERGYLHERLGAWHDSRFGADAELMQRLFRFDPNAISVLDIPVMLQLDSPAGLTRLPDTFVDGSGESEARRQYRESWERVHLGSDEMPCY